MEPKKDHVVALNRKARHDYFVVDTFECGVVLTGTEIKSVRTGKVNLKDGYAKFERGELWLMNVHISPYEKASWYQHDPRQNRKLLLHKSELRRLGARVKEKGFTLVPLSMYLKEGRIAKVALALAQGKNGTTAATRSSNATPSAPSHGSCATAAKSISRSFVVRCSTFIGGDQVRLVWWKSESRPSDRRYLSQKRNDNNYALAA